MIRQVAAVALAVCLSQPFLHAQGTMFTVGAPSAEVHRAPSTGSPVIGTARRGAALEVTRELGSWVKVSWPDAQNGEAFVHVSRGAIAHRSGSRTGDTFSSLSDTDRPSVASDVAGVEQRVLGLSRVAPSPVLPPAYAVPSHVFGLGARMGVPSPVGFGLGARAWHDRLGVQLNMSRDAFISTMGPERLVSMKIEPSVLFSPMDHVTDYVWVRPYVGSGFSVDRRTLRNGPVDVSSSNGLGLQAFGGGEMTFAGLPQFALSTDIGYRWARTSLPGFDLTGMTFAFSAHWYVR